MRAPSSKVVALAAVVALGAAAVASSTQDGGAATTAYPARWVVTDSGRHFLLNGRPALLFIANVWPDCDYQEEIAGGLRMGVELFWSYQTTRGCDMHGRAPRDYLHSLLRSRALWFDLYASQDPDGSAGEEFRDLPELADWRSAVPLGWEKRPWSYWRPSNNWRFGTLREACTSTTRLFADTQRLARRRPMLTVVPAISSTREFACLRPRLLSAIVMTAVAAGADGILYAIETVGQGRVWFDVRPDVQDEAARIAALLRQVEPAIAGGTPLRARWNAQGPLRAGAWRDKRADFVIAVNTRSSRTSGRVTIATGTGTADVVGEGRTVRVRRGGISDSFAPLGWHVYRIPR